jgi:glycyl-tRNA synthetase alpha chain
MSLNFQELIHRLSAHWAERGATVLQPYDVEVGAGALSPVMALPCLGPEPWRAACVQRCRRPEDGRYAENPLRLSIHHQFQVMWKPAPDDGRSLFLQSLLAIGIDGGAHDLRFVGEDLEIPALDLFGAGARVVLDGMPVARCHYLQRMGGHDLEPVSLSIAMGLERLALFVQGVEDVFDLAWSDSVKYGELHRRREVEFSRHRHEESEPAALIARFDDAESEAHRLLDSRLVMPAYDLLLNCAHLARRLDAAASDGAGQKPDLTGRIRALARACCNGWIESHSIEEMKSHANS